jgi:hypothetical protein
MGILAILLPVVRFRRGENVSHTGGGVAAVAIRSADCRHHGQPGVSAAGWADRSRVHHEASAEHVSVHESAADVEALEVSAGTHCLLNRSELHFALGLVRSLAVAADAEEHDGDQSQEEGDNQADFDQGHPGAVEALRDAIGWVGDVDFHVLYGFCNPLWIFAGIIITAR